MSSEKSWSNSTNGSIFWSGPSPPGHRPLNCLACGHRFRLQPSGTLTQGEYLPADLAPADRAALENIVRHLEVAWNAMDGAAFAAPFAADADFVNIRGEHFRGQAAVAAGHAAIFRTIYAGSTVHFTVEAARLLRPEVALVRVHSMLDAPRGPLAGPHGARFSSVLTKEPGGWKIAAFHNTLEAAKAGG